MLRIATRTITLIAFLLVSLALPAMSSDDGALNFEERVQYQRLIEDVYWQNRIWPDENPGLKPALDEVMPDAVIRERVQSYLEKSAALEKFWSRPLTGEQLQAEMDRMVRHTKSPEMLAELFAALDDDPFLIAECLARPVLVDRLTRNWYARDTRFHGTLREQAETSLTAYSGDLSSMPDLGGRYEEVEFRLAPEESRAMDFEVNQTEHQVIDLDTEEWSNQVERTASLFGVGCEFGETCFPSDLLARIPSGTISRLTEKNDRFMVMSVLSAGQDYLQTATVTWIKRPFETWWMEEGRIAIESSDDHEPVKSPYDGYKIRWRINEGCSDDTWTATRDAVTARKGHSAVWTGAEMIVWGGHRHPDYPIFTGGRYNPATDSWTATSTGEGAPHGRIGHKAVWTGTEMIVWGGYRSYTTYPWGSVYFFYNNGGRYNPVTNRWMETSTGEGVPSGRFGHTAVWTGTEMIVWGGRNSIGPLNTGGRYNPDTDSWTSTSTGAGVPATRYDHTAVWTGSEMIVWGGQNTDTPFSNTGGRYNPATDSWTATSIGDNVPSGRQGPTAVWTGTEMIVWGGVGRDGWRYEVYDTGGRYDPATDTWTITSTGDGVPSGRIFHTAVWTGSEMIVWGGRWLGPYHFNTGGRYDPATDSWTATSTGAGVPSERQEHTAVWTGTEMIIWGGYGYQSLENTGGRYDPVTDSWTPTYAGEGLPLGRIFQTAVWTGSEMIIWGGYLVETMNTGGRYDPATDNWSATSIGDGAPQGRRSHTAIWTGTEMIVWGGRPAHYIWNPLDKPLSTGGRYNPVTDSWMATSTGDGVPTGRTGHTAVWTGSEMIVWGGYQDEGEERIDHFPNAPSRYDPVTDSWTATATGDNAPLGRTNHTAVWTGSEMLVWGGYTPELITLWWYTGWEDVDLNTGGRYDPATDSWTATSTGDNVPLERRSHTAVWTGTEMIVWGGSKVNLIVSKWARDREYVYLNTGGRYDPETDSWQATSTGGGVPFERSRHTAVWTGTEMIVWGGYKYDYLERESLIMNSGGRYDPAIDCWVPTSIETGVPVERLNHSAVWTGTQMIVWGGQDSRLHLSSGGLYCACEGVRERVRHELHENPGGGS